MLPLVAVCVGTVPWHRNLSVDADVREGAPLTMYDSRC